MISRNIFCIFVDQSKFQGISIQISFQLPSKFIFIIQGNSNWTWGYNRDFYLTDLKNICFVSISNENKIWQFYTRSTDLYFSELLEIKHLHMKASKMKRYLIKGRTYRIYRNHFNVKLEDTSMNTIGEFHSVKWKMYTIKLG